MKNNNKQHYCDECKYYDTGEDWGLCCTNLPDTPDVMYWGWLCFECTESCKNFEERSKEDEGFGCL